MKYNVFLKPKERLQRVADELDMSIRQLAQMAEMSEATLYHVTDGTREMTGRTASRLCYHIEKNRGLLVNRDWLLTGKGEMLVTLKPEPKKEAEEATPVAAKLSGLEVEHDWKGRYYQLLERYSELQAKYTEMLEKR